jgi:hypothetical protein
LVILVGANLLADVVIVAPLLALPDMMRHFQTDQAAWLNSSAMLAGARDPDPTGCPRPAPHPRHPPLPQLLLTGRRPTPARCASPQRW